MFSEREMMCFAVQNTVNVLSKRKIMCLVIESKDEMW